MTPERLAEFRTFALGAIPQVAQLSDESESTRVIISTCASAMLELIDALTAERERAEKARRHRTAVRLWTLRQQKQAWLRKAAAGEYDWFAFIYHARLTDVRERRRKVRGKSQ